MTLELLFINQLTAKRRLVYSFSVDKIVASLQSIKWSKVQGPSVHGPRLPKDPVDVNEITGIIYQVPCYDCPFVYIGQTKRDLKSRLLEHKRAIKYKRPGEMWDL